jgi:hypothetical protein
LQTKTLILIVLIFTGCAVTRRNIPETTPVESGKALYAEAISDLNVTNYNFNIIKAVIEIRTNEEKRKIIANMKFRKPGTYLISIRNQTGIEATRFFINPDTILINDRINKKIYFGSTDYLKTKYGISTNALPVLIGDFIGNVRETKQIKCDNNKANIRQFYEEREVDYEINCSKRKVSNIRVYDPESKKGLIIEFGKFDKIENVTLGRNIKIFDKEEETSINIEIEKIELNKDDEITFIPGKGYEKVLLK